MKNTLEIKNFWNDQALAHGASSEATMPDRLLKDLEIENILKYLNKGTYVADIGCGNGYSTFIYSENLDIKIDGIDYSEEMIKIANKSLENYKGKNKNNLSFLVGDINALNVESEKYDTVITDRCLINLTSRESQECAIKEISRVLKKGGLYLMCEDTEQGLGNLNQMRRIVGLEEISVRWHNLYLDENHMLDFSKKYFELVDVIKFSSFYYLASRIINGKIAQEKNEQPRYDSSINKVAKLISSSGDFGDYGPLKLFVFKKR